MTAEGQAGEWLRHAESDLALARAAAATPSVLPEQAAFHAQQAVEKVLKALLLARGIDFPRTHDLQELIDLLAEAEGTLPADLLATVDLTPPLPSSIAIRETKSLWEQRRSGLPSRSPRRPFDGSAGVWPL